MDTIYPDQDGRVILIGGEFGWGWFKHNDALTKANYAAQDAVDYDLLSEVIKEQTGASEVIFKDMSDGYVDNQSYGTAPRTKEELKNFIFNKNSWLFGGNDNSTPDPTFYDVPEIRDGKMIVPKYKYELKIEGLNKTTKFKDKPTDSELSYGIDALLRNGTLMTYDGQFINDDSIMWQITRPRDYFEVSWHVKQDYSSGEIIFTKEGGEIYRVERELEEQGKYKGLNWYQKQVVLTNYILTFPSLYRKVKFTLEEI